MEGYDHCYNHRPDLAEERRRNAVKGGRRGGRGRGSNEIASIKDQLRELVALLRTGEVDRADAAVCGQLLNVYLRSIESERRRRAEEQEMLSLEQVRGLIGAYTEALHKHVKDGKILEAISREIRAYSEHAPDQSRN